MEMHLCEKFGFDLPRISACLAMVGLQHQDRSLSDYLHHDLIVPEFSKIIDRYMQKLLSLNEFKAILKSDELLETERTEQTKYLLSFGIGFDSQNYFEHRLRLGLAHSAQALPLSLLLCKSRLLIESMIENIPPQSRNNLDQYQSLLTFINKINTLDLSLALDTYVSHQLKSFEQSLGGMQVLATHLEKQAITDSLTGMINHEHVFSELQLALNKARHDNTPLCIVMADLDHFKKVNDTYGHQAGDGVLKEVAARIKNSLRGFDIVGRYGGEEFLLILNRADIQAARIVAERIRSRIVATPIDLPNALLDVTISMGVADATMEDDVTSLVERADRALYSAKENGRNQVALAD